MYEESIRSEYKHVVDRLSFPITPAPKGRTKVEAMLNFDTYGYLTVKAKEWSSGTWHTMELVWAFQTLKDEIARSAEKLKQFEADDLLEQQRIKAKDDL